MPVNVRFHALAEERMLLIAAAQEPDDDPIRLLKTRPFIRFNRNAVLGTLIGNWILPKRIAVLETMELGSPKAISSMVEANLGVSIVPDLSVKPKSNVRVKRLSLRVDAPTRTLGFVYHKDQVKTQAIDALSRVIEMAKLDKVTDAQ